MRMDFQSSNSSKVELVRLRNGHRLLRVTDSATGVCLEKKAEETRPIRLQSKQLIAALRHIKLEPVSS